jgi:hypothetical protein
MNECHNPFVAQDISPLRRPIFIIGAPRSGTTNLGSILARHPALAYLEEPRLTWRYGNDSKSDRLRPSDATTPVIEHIRTTFAHAVRHAGKRRLLEKTPSNGLRIGFIDRIFPDCLFVHIIRNGLESTLATKSFWENSAAGFTGLAPGRIGQRFREVSLRRIPYYLTELIRRGSPKWLAGVVGPNVWGPRIPGLQRLLRDLTLVEVCALQWRMTVELACIEGRRLPRHRYLEVRIEDLSPQVIDEIVLFCGLEPCKSLAEQGRAFYDPARARRRIDDADEDDLVRIREWIEPTMSWLGYNF